MIDSPDAIEQSKTASQSVLDSVRFKANARYEDYREGDKHSGMGLKALVLGGAGIAVVKAAKAGFIIKLLLVLKKGIIVIFVAIGGFFKWLFGRKRNKDDVTPPDPTPPSDAPTTPPAV